MGRDARGLDGGRVHRAVAVRPFRSPGVVGVLEGLAGGVVCAGQPVEGVVGLS